MDRFISLRQNAQEEIERIEIVEDLQDVVKGQFHTIDKHARVHVFGSSATGVGASGTDIDLCFVGRTKRTAETAAQKRERVLKSGEAPQGRRRLGNGATPAFRSMEGGIRHSREFDLLEAVVYARVPIMKFKHAHFGYDLDMCFNNMLALHNSALLRAYVMCDYPLDRVRPLCFLVKNWAKKRGLGEARDGGLSSYSWVLLMIGYLQIRGVLPCLQDEQVLDASDAWAAAAKATRGTSGDHEEEEEENEVLGT